MPTENGVDMSVKPLQKEAVLAAEILAASFAAFLHSTPNVQQNAYGGRGNVVICEHDERKKKHAFRLLYSRTILGANPANLPASCRCL